MKKFTGYINLDGVHIEDGLKHPPVSFQETDTQIILRWIEPVGGLYEPSYEKEVRISKVQALNGHGNLSAMKTGVNAWNAYLLWLGHNSSEPILLFPRSHVDAG